MIFNKFDIEKILIEMDIPLFFTCRDKDNNALHLGMCVEDDNGIIIYLIIPIDKCIIDKLLSNKITFKEIYKDKTFPIQYHVKFINYIQVSVTKIFNSSINEEWLPHNKYWE